MRTVAVINQKGGCGKTTTAINLSAVAAGEGNRVLLIDLDPQSHCAAGLAIPESKIERHIGDLLVRDPAAGPINVSEWVWQVRSNLDLIPSTMALAAIEAPGRGLSGLPDRDRRLESVLARIGEGYDWCVVDCPPSVGLLTFNALRAATNVLIPVETSFFALQGAEKQVQTIRTVQSRLARPLPFAILPTMFDDRIRLSREILDELTKRYAEYLSPRPIRYCVRLRESSSFGQPIVEYDEEAESSNDYRALYRWITANLPDEIRSFGCGRLVRSMEEARAMTSQHRSAVLGANRAETTTVQPVQPEETSTQIHSEDHRTPAVAESTPHDNPPEDSQLHTEKTTDTQAPSEKRKPVEVPEIASVGIRHGGDSGSFTEHIVRPRQHQVTPSETPGSRAAEMAQRANAMTRPHQTLHDRRRERTGLDHAVRRFEDKARPAVVAQVRRLSGARQTPQGVLFVYPGLSPNQEVSVVGDFNDWSATANPMRYNDRLQIFETCITIPSGRYEYQFFVDGHAVEHPSVDVYSDSSNCEPVVIEIA